MIRYFIFVAMILLPFGSLYGAENNNAEDREYSIFDEDRRSRSHLTLEFVISKNWSFTGDDSHRPGDCKYYAHEIHIDEAMKTLGFTLEDMVSIPEDETYKYDENSPYWYSCNRVYSGNPDVPKKLTWFDAEYVMKGPFLVAFVKYLDKEKGSVRIVVVDKYEQMAMNRAVKETWWDRLVNLVYVLIYSHPKPNNDDFDEDELDGKAK